LREEATEKGKDEQLSTIQSMIPTKQEWRVKEKMNTPALMTSDDEMDPLDDNESLLIRDGSPPPTDMDISMVFMSSATFRGVEGEIT
jgi:hypothetical protein